MWWSEGRGPDAPGRGRLLSRRLLLAALPLAAAGCFRPMLAEDGGAAALRGRIALPRVAGRNAYYLYQTLEERLGTPRDPDHRLEVRLALRRRGLAIAPDASVTRRTITATADWKLFRNGTAEPLLAARELAQSGYNESGDLYATRVTERDVERRLTAQIGEQIARQVLARAPEAAPVGS